MVSDRVNGKEKSLNFRYLDVEICENALACWDELFIYDVNYPMRPSHITKRQYNSTSILV